MIENIDNLPPEFWTENELDQMALEAIEVDKYAEQKTNIVFLHLFKDLTRTGLVMILAVQSVMDAQEAVDRLWAGTGITAVVGEYNEESYLNQQRVEALYLVLHKYKYAGKQKLPGSDNVYMYEPWMEKLI